MMIDVVTTGFSALQEMRREGPELVMHAHRAMHAAMTRKEKHGITMQTLGQIYRLIGVDQLHVGTAVGKMEGGKQKVRWIEDNVKEKEIKKDDIPPQEKSQKIAMDWHNIKPAFPVSSGGLHPGLIHELIGFMGKDIIIQAGGGVHGHPEGSRKGAKAMRQAVEAKLKGINPKEYAEKEENKELKKALGKWGTGPK